MKRIKFACLEQTTHFQLKEDIPHDDAIIEVENELAAFKAFLDRKHTKYKIVQETAQSDGSILLKIKKQYNSYDLGDYLD